LVLSTTSSESARLRCLQSGANAFLPVSVSASVLLLKLVRLLELYWSRPSEALELERQEDQSWSVEVVQSTLHINGFTAKFSPCQFRVVEQLMRRTEKWLHADLLLREALGVRAVDSSRVKFHVSRVRQRAGLFRWFLHGAPHRGYMWSVDACDESHCQDHLVERARDLRWAAVAYGTPPGRALGVRSRAG
jgi:DNA-binding response OmpR family regulator